MPLYEVIYRPRDNGGSRTFQTGCARVARNFICSPESFGHHVDPAVAREVSVALGKTDCPLKMLEQAPLSDCPVFVVEGLMVYVRREVWDWWRSSQ